MGSPPPPPSSQPQPQPEIPLRSASELHELRAGASESLRRTSLDTGFTDRTDDARAERETSEALLTFRAVQDEEDGEEGEGKDVKRDVKPLMRLSYQGPFAFSLAFALSVRSAFGPFWLTFPSRRARLFPSPCFPYAQCPRPPLLAHSHSIAPVRPPRLRSRALPQASPSPRATSYSSSNPTRPSPRPLPTRDAHGAPTRAACPAPPPSIARRRRPDRAARHRSFRIRGGAERVAFDRASSWVIQQHDRCRSFRMPVPVDVWHRARPCSAR